MLTTNYVVLAVRVIADPDPLMTTKTGLNVCSLRCVVMKRGKKRPDGTWEDDPNPTWIDCTAFSKPGGSFNLAEFLANNARKGSQLLVQGELAMDSWKDKQTGQKRSKHKVILNKAEFISSKDENAGGGVPAAFRSQAPQQAAYRPQPQGPANGRRPVYSSQDMADMEGDSPF